MDFTLAIILFLIVGVVAVVPAFLRPRKILCFPFMIGACVLVWIVPQAYVTGLDPAEITGDMVLRFSVYSSACVIAGLLGYYYAIRSSKRLAYQIRHYNPEKAYILGRNIGLLGAGGHIGLWVYGPVEGLWTGWPVYFFALSKISLAGVPLLILSYLKTRLTYRLHLAIMLLLPWIASTFTGGRRENTFSVIALILAVAILRMKWQPPRILLPLGLILAAVISYAFPFWRSTFKEKGFFESIKETPINEVVAATREKGGDEFRDSVILFEVIRLTSDHQYGLGFIDRIVKEYVPGTLIGPELKAAMRPLEDNWDYRIAKASSMGRIINGYNANAGFMDAFLEFSYPGILLFGVLGYIWGRITRPAFSGDDTSFHFMCLFALSPAHFVYSGIVMRICLDLVSYVIILYARYTCSLRIKGKSKPKGRSPGIIQEPRPTTPLA